MNRTFPEPLHRPLNSTDQLNLLLHSAAAVPSTTSKLDIPSTSGKIPWVAGSELNTGVLHQRLSANRLGLLHDDQRLFVSKLVEYMHVITTQVLALMQFHFFVGRDTTSILKLMFCTLFSHDGCT